MKPKRIKYCDEIDARDAEDVRFQKDKNAAWIRSLRLIDGKHYSPIDICYKEAKVVQLFDLQWHHYDIVPSKMKLTNTGRSLVLSAEWIGYHPYLKDGPLMNGKYVFSQMHFLWGGERTLEGTEHTIDGKRGPLEVHFVHFRKTLFKQDRALKVPGAVVIIVQMYEIAFHKNLMLEQLFEDIEKVKEFNTETCVHPIPLSHLICPFRRDYYVYWGKLRSVECEHIVQWLIPRKIHSVSLDQLHRLQKLMNPNLLPIKRSWGRTPDRTRQTLFMVDPSTPVLATTWLQIPLCKSDPEFVRLILLLE